MIEPTSWALIYLLGLGVTMAWGVNGKWARDMGASLFILSFLLWPITLILTLLALVLDSVVTTKGKGKH